MTIVDTTTATLHWRPMTAIDLVAVNAIAAAVHVDYPEDAAVFAERLALHPQGCYVLGAADSSDAGLAGYIISHPWRLGEPPALNALLGAVPSPASTYYIHDIALLPRARGSGATDAVLATLLPHAATIADNVSLVAVGGTVPFWRRHKFASRDSSALTRKLASYGTDASYMTRPLSADPAGATNVS
ncbi:GNAT family N-acetyltransferase [Rhodopseudomonas palustris]|uniref:GNAT family N-acetyltransferase n=1 Tax=Rhodopseudomonas palustris TaxID=1076 RepID=UPI0020CE25B8|nr:GNAT family N-acetyltransferase [Rhodopseudomonas palustris]MCP9626431.1 GNAT family N-acetyltransferase [Rhodopseudomonas palustris]